MRARAWAHISWWLGDRGATLLLGRSWGGKGLEARRGQRSSGFSPVRPAILASILEPISSRSWTAHTTSCQSSLSVVFSAIQFGALSASQCGDAPRRPAEPSSPASGSRGLEGHVDELGRYFAVLQPIGNDAEGKRLHVGDCVACGSVPCPPLSVEHWNAPRVRRAETGASVPEPAVSGGMSTGRVSPPVSWWCSVVPRSSADTGTTRRRTSVPCSRWPSSPRSATSRDGCRTASATERRAPG